MLVGCDGVRVCSGELCSRSPHLQNLWDASIGEELPCKKDSGNEKDPYIVAVVRRSIIVGQVPRKISTTPPTHTIDCNDITTKYWHNLIWWCVHSPPNRQIKFPAIFSGHTVYMCTSSYPVQSNSGCGWGCLLCWIITVWSQHSCCWTTNGQTGT